MRKILIGLLIVIAVSLSSQTYQLQKSVLDCAGNRSSSSSYILIDATGQAITGRSISSSYIETAGIFHINLNTISGIVEDLIGEINNVPLVFTLSENYPNPCDNITNIRFGIPYASHVNICLYDASGRCVKEILNNEVQAGYHNISLNTKSYSSGIYFLRMNSETFNSTKKLIVAR